ncbi:MAG: hypothetical protein AB2A00_33790 [Myxococcota bacterium]
MNNLQPFNITTWPLYQAWEKATSRMLENTMRDNSFLELSGQMMRNMLQSKKTLDRMFGLEAAGDNHYATEQDVAELRQRVVELERRIVRLESGRKGGNAAGAEA